MKIYDVFKDRYIEESEKDLLAPPERYKEITDDLLISNAARWFVEAFINNGMREGEQDGKK